MRTVTQTTPPRNFQLYENDREPREYRGFTLLRDGEHLFWRCQEPCPHQLAGQWFTTITIAQNFIDLYLKEQNELNEAETTS